MIGQCEQPPGFNAYKIKIKGTIYLLSTGKQLKRGWFKYLQVLFIDKPTDREIEVAIEGIKEYEKMEDSIKRNYKGAIFIGFIN